MTEPINPLMAASKSRTFVGKWKSLEEYRDWINDRNWVRDSGKPYFISTRDDGERSLDRKV